jgi:hypothetical protein
MSDYGVERTVERITFVCGCCKLTSAGLLEFMYWGQTDWRGKFLVKTEHEETEGLADCAWCGATNEVWPIFSTSKTWEAR